MTNKRAKTAAKNWARANRLAELSNIEAPICRNYLTTADEDSKRLLDGTTDARNKTIRTMIEEVKTHVAPARASKGNKTKPPRAGAPTDKPHSHKSANSIDLLLDIKKLADKHGGLEQIESGLAALKKLRD